MRRALDVRGQERSAGRSRQGVSTALPKESEPVVKAHAALVTALSTLLLTAFATYIWRELVANLSFLLRSTVFLSLITACVLGWRSTRDARAWERFRRLLCTRRLHGHYDCRVRGGCRLAAITGSSRS